MPDAVEERFWSKVERGADDECWPWQGSIEQHGYARFWPTSDTGIMVHRFAYELANGPIPEGLVIDHLCRVPHCVNPKHLEAVTNGENVLRGEGPTAVNARKTHCKRGHEFTDENTLLNGGKRFCKTCKREADIIRHAREREAKLEAEVEKLEVGFYQEKERAEHAEAKLAEERENSAAHLSLVEKLGSKLAEVEAERDEAVGALGEDVALMFKRSRRAADALRVKLEAAEAKLAEVTETARYEAKLAKEQTARGDGLATRLIEHELENYGRYRGALMRIERATELIENAHIICDTCEQVARLLSGKEKA